MHGFLRLAHIEFICMCKCNTLYVCICASKSNEPKTYQQEHLWIIREYKQNYKGTRQSSNNKHYP